jgi:hypothetical protein
MMMVLPNDFFSKLFDDINNSLNKKILQLMLTMIEEPNCIFNYESMFFSYFRTGDVEFYTMEGENQTNRLSFILFICTK